jgi:hypothetical protein
MKKDDIYDPAGFRIPVKWEEPDLPHKPKPRERHIGCPVWFLRRVVEAVGGEQLAVGLYLYRLRHIHRSKTVKVPNGWLEEQLGISRHVKYRALRALEAAGIVRAHPSKQREAVVITFLV